VVRQVALGTADFPGVPMGLGVVGFPMGSDIVAFLGIVAYSFYFLAQDN